MGFCLFVLDSNVLFSVPDPVPSWQGVLDDQHRSISGSGGIPTVELEIICYSVVVAVQSELQAELGRPGAV
jgi:hypothetical protein